MRTYASSRPYGVRLRGWTDVKLKGLAIWNAGASQSLPPDASVFWGTAWDWAGDVQPQIDLAVSLGANCVKFETSIYEVVNSQTTTLARMGQVLDYLDSLGLLSYWCLSQFTYEAAKGLSLAEIAAGMQPAARLLDGYGGVVALDLINEINSESSDSSTRILWMEALTPAVRAATGLPLTYSLYVGDSSVWGSSVVGEVAPYVDFHDFHPYNGLTSPPQPSDVDAYRALGYDRPFLCGEAGCDASRFSASTQTSFWEAYGTLAALEDCYGDVGFCVADYNSTREWGVYDDTLAGPRTQISVPFAAWPAQS